MIFIVSIIFIFIISIRVAPDYLTVLKFLWWLKSLTQSMIPSISSHPLFPHQALPSSLCCSHIGYICVLQTLKFVPVSVWTYTPFLEIFSCLLNMNALSVFQVSAQIITSQQIFPTILFSLTQYIPNCPTWK